LANTICPICKDENKCKTGAGENKDSCWCTIEKFPKEIFALLPEESLRKHCICKNCLETYTNLRD